MTTVYVNKRLGVVLTDMRTTTSTYREFFGLEFGVVNTFSENTNKAMYIHDRVFAISGCTTETEKVAQYLAYGIPLVPAPKSEKLCANCLYVDKNWILQIILEKGKVQKYFLPIKSGFHCGTGSGWAALEKELKKYSEPTLDEVIAAFKTVHKSDKYTNDQIQIHKI